jgi:hypothetical protein
VYCGWVLGSWRVVGVQLQLNAAVVVFNDSAMASAQGVLAGMSYLRELEVLCVTHRPPSPGEKGPGGVRGWVDSGCCVSACDMDNRQVAGHTIHLLPTSVMLATYRG